MITIYRITSPTGRKYIGQTKNLSKRKSLYKILKCKQQSMLYNSLKLYGYSTHLIEVLEEVPESQADAAEIKWIASENSYFTEGGMNLTRGGLRPKHTQETRQKLSQMILGAKNIKAKKLYQYSIEKIFIKEWECMKCIERELGFFTSMLSQAAKGNGKAYGYLWSYVPLH